MARITPIGLAATNSFLIFVEINELVVLREANKRLAQQFLSLGKIDIATQYVEIERGITNEITRLEYKLSVKDSGNGPHNL